ncbi:MAG: hypothetical protein IPL38_14515 [Rhodobacter sp.]|jgi:hypothetical protein|nr:hypothetical protein [Rhodobacter sp.]MBK8440649.1 hypothetical protein [Rhodobacter sp.]
MDTDLFLTIGIVLGVLTIPSLLSAWTESRVPRVGALMLMAAAGLIALAISQKPGGYTFGDVPDVMMNVVGRYVN